MSFWHGGPPNLKANQLILPPCKTGYPCASDYGAEHVHRRDRVYITTEELAAKMYAAMHPSRRGWVYEVLPVGELEPDPDCNEPGLSYACESAVILRAIPVTQWERGKIFSALQLPRALL